MKTRYVTFKKIVKNPLQAVVKSVFLSALKIVLGGTTARRGIRRGGLYLFWGVAGKRWIAYDVLHEPGLIG